MAYGVFFSTVITIIREQVYLLVSYGAAFVTAKIVSGYFVKSQGIMGASILYAVLMGILAVILGAVMFIKIYKRKGAIDKAR